jgi:hypothetical protein
MNRTCPTCRAAFSGESKCRRCGTDLSSLFAVLLAAREARDSARRALLAGDGEAALAAALRARRLEDSTASRRLHVLALLSVDRLLDGVRLADRVVT